jgi:hypothetical protein
LVEAAGRRTTRTVKGAAKILCCHQDIFSPAATSRRVNASGINGFLSRGSRKRASVKCVAARVVFVTQRGPSELRAVLPRQIRHANPPPLVLRRRYRLARHRRSGDGNRKLLAEYGP